MGTTLGGGEGPPEKNTPQKCPPVENAPRTSRGAFSTGDPPSLIYYSPFHKSGSQMHWIWVRFYARVGPKSVGPLPCLPKFLFEFWIHLRCRPPNYITRLLNFYFKPIKGKVKVFKVMNHFLRHHNIKCLDTIPLYKNHIF